VRQRLVQQPVVNDQLEGPGLGQVGEDDADGAERGDEQAAFDLSEVGHENRRKRLRPMA
jgi:hypothetical protein